MVFQVIHLMGEVGLLPLLVGQLRNGHALERALMISALGLLVAVVGASRAQRSVLCSMQGVMGLVGTALVDQELVCRRLGLQLLNELVMCKQVSMTRCWGAVLRHGVW